MKDLKPIRFLALLVLLYGCVPKVHNKSVFNAKPSKGVNPKIPGIRFDGAYYIIDTIRNKSNCLTYYAFYINGIVSRGYVCVPKTSEVDKRTIRKAVNTTYKDSLLNGKENEFGGILVNDGNLTIQLIYYKAWFSWEPFTLQGAVLNDSTIHLTQQLTKSYKQPVNLYLHFIPTIRPDSLLNNPWRNRKWYWAK